MIKGKVLYRDIYDQKGIYCFFMQSVAAIISKNTFLGVYIIEVICFSIFIYYTIHLWKEINYAGDINIFIIPYLVLFVFLIVISVAFYRGGSVEELSLPLFMYAIYKIVCFINGKSDEFLWVKLGMVTAVLFWIKFTMCIFMIGIAFYVLYYCLKKKDMNKLFPIAGKWLVGMFILTIPVIIYCMVTHSFFDLFKYYIYENMFTYTKSRASLFRIIIFVVTKLNFLIVVLGIIALVKKAFPKKYVPLLICISMAGVIYSLFLTYTVVYVLLIFVPVYGLLWAGIIKLFDEAVKDEVKILKKVPKELVTVLLILVFALGACAFSENTKYIKYKKDDYIYYRYASLINSKKDSTLLVYNYFDEGFYVAAKKIPEVKYFTKYNIKMDDAIKEQIDYVNQGKADFIITVDEKPEEVEKNYTLIKDEEYTNYYTKATYYLWEKK